MLQPGAHLGPYEILAAIGAGGMGEVYRARDTRLDRTVAIKVLPEHLSKQPELRERFEREARAVSNLNHPNICTLHDVGEQDGLSFLVLEYIEGENLEARLARGPLPFHDALRYAGEIADALDKAHRLGIVHRDLKPGNIIIAATGAKLLDFGLAKFREPVAKPVFTSASQLPTQGSNLTLSGTIIGTLQYMAPEQLEGKEADARTDIFALGVMLYEMITGRKAFQGKSQVSLIAAILEHEPTPIRSIQPLVPDVLDHVVTRCLAKNPDDRWQTASDLVHELQWVQTAKPPEIAVQEVPRSRRIARRIAWPLAIVSLLVAGTLSVLHFFSPEPSTRAVRFEIFPPPKAVFGTTFGTTDMAISPDGSMVAFVSVADGKRQILVRPLDSVETMALTGTDGASFPFWSPDNRFIVFWADGKLKKIEVAGGPPQTLCTAAGFIGGTWNQDGIILFGAIGAGIQRISAEGGTPVQITALDPSRQERSHRWPRFLPDGNHFLFFAASNDSEKNEVYVGALSSKSTTPVMNSQFLTDYAPPGWLLFVREAVLFAQHFDPNSLKVNGDPVRVAENLAVLGGATNRADYSVSNNGVLLFRQGAGSGGGNLELIWYDRSGKELSRVGGAWNYRGLDLSPDGKRIGVHRHDDRNGGDIWTTEVSNGSHLRLTFEPSQENSSPVWSPDGSHIAFASLRNGAWGIYQKASSGVGSEELLYESKSQVLPMAWSRDGETIAFRSGSVGAGDIWLLPLKGDRKPKAYLQTPAAKSHPQISPDGHWLAYESNESGRNEIYIQSFPVPGTKYQISTELATWPRWNRDGREIFFMNGGRTMASVTIELAGEALKYSAPKVLFESRYVNLPHTGPYHTFAVTGDGQRFLIPVQPGSASDVQNPLTVIVNWTSMLKR